MVIISMGPLDKQECECCDRPFVIGFGFQEIYCSMECRDKHDPSCSLCTFYTGHIELLCTVDPIHAKRSGKAKECTHYHPK